MGAPASSTKTVVAGAAEHGRDLTICQIIERQNKVTLGCWNFSIFMTLIVHLPDT
jgi:hypothetical protein